MRNLKHIFSKAALFYLIGCRLLIPRICLANHDSVTLPSFVKSISSPQISFNTSGLFKEIRANLEHLKTLDDEYSNNPANAKKIDSKEAPTSEIQATYERNKEEFDSKIKEVIEKLNKQLGELRKNSSQLKSSEKKDFNGLIGSMEKAISEHSQKVATKTETSEITDNVKNKKKRTPEEKQSLQDQINNLRDSILNHAESGDSFGNQLAEQYKETLSQLTKLEKELNSNQIALEKISNKYYPPYKPSPPSDEEDSLSDEGTENAGSITPNIPSVVRKSQPPSDSTSLTPTHISSGNSSNSSGNSSDSFPINENSNISSEKLNAPILNPDNKNNTFAAPPGFIPSPTVNSLAQKSAVFPDPTAPIIRNNLTNIFYPTATASASASAAVPTIDSPADVAVVQGSLPNTSNIESGYNSGLGFSLRDKKPNTPNFQLKYIFPSDSPIDLSSTSQATTYDSTSSSLESNNPKTFDDNSDELVPSKTSENLNWETASLENYIKKEGEEESLGDYVPLPASVGTNRLFEILEALKEPTVPTVLLDSEIPKLLVEANKTPVDTKKYVRSLAALPESTRGLSPFDRFVAWWLGI